MINLLNLKTSFYKNKNSFLFNSIFWTVVVHEIMFSFHMAFIKIWNKKKTFLWLCLLIFMWPLGIIYNHFVNSCVVYYILTMSSWVNQFFKSFLIKYLWNCLTHMLLIMKVKWMKKTPTLNWFYDLHQWSKRYNK